MAERFQRWRQFKRDWLMRTANKLKLWTLFLCLVMLGVPLGMAWERQSTQPELKRAHDEISRLQLESADLIGLINTRLPPLVGKVDQAAGQIGEASEKLDQAADVATRASKTAREAAETANGAAVNAARANIHVAPAAPATPAAPSPAKPSGKVPDWLNTP